MSKGISLAIARAAKDSLRRLPMARHWGIGLMRRDGILGLKVNVPTAAERKLVPVEVDAVPVHQVEIVSEVVALAAKTS